MSSIKSLFGDAMNKKVVIIISGLIITSGILSTNNINFQNKCNKEVNIVTAVSAKDNYFIIPVSSTKYLSEDDVFITCVFGELNEDGKIKVKATEAKMARGLMVRYMASNNITEIDDIKKFVDLSFKYSAEYSTDKEFVFLKQI